MGGKVFTDLTVPRLPHDLYNEIRTECHQILENYYGDVVTPAEAPSKRDHGDIDFMVSRPKPLSRSRGDDNDAVTTAKAGDIAKALGAVKWKHTSNSKTSHFAVPYPKDLTSLTIDDSTKSEQLYAQVDVHVVPDAAFLPWERFLNSYGDLLQILGVLNRPLGLTANDTGVYLRIPEIEPINRRKAMIFLTDSPREMLTFLRLDADAYDRGFVSNEDVFEWCLSGGLYAPPKQHEETSNDRARIKKRDMFTECMRIYYPLHKDRLWPPTRRIWTRQDVLEEALKTFPSAQATYNDAMVAYRREKFELQVLADMRALGSGLGAEEKDITEVVRGSKRFVDYVEGKWIVSGVQIRDVVDLIPHWMEHLLDENGKTRFLDWLNVHWKELHEHEQERMRLGKDGRAAAKDSAGA